MMTSSNGNMYALLAFCAGNSLVTGVFPSQRPVTRCFDVFSDLRLNECLSKQPWAWWFATPSRPLWHHSYVGSSGGLSRLIDFKIGEITIISDDVNTTSVNGSITISPCKDTLYVANKCVQTTKKNNFDFNLSIWIQNGRMHTSPVSAV